MSSSFALSQAVGASRLPGPGDRVVVAMSGGVDSSVVAALLHERGCEVIGLTLSLYEGESDVEGGCCSPEDVSDARRVCGDLGVPHYVLNYREKFHQLVVQPFVDSYRRGETPNPCVGCNTFLKFDQLLGKARELQAPWLATGHYARITATDDGSLRLLSGLDHSKDQSYFLWGIRRKVLPYLTFPLGGMSKAEVRDAARRLSVRTCDKPDSQDVCFVPKGKTAEFVESRGGSAGEGNVVDGEGRVLGRHDGVHAFTIGQRRGIGVASSAPLYVTRLDAKKKLVVVGGLADLQTRRVVARDWNWLRKPKAGESLTARVRYRSPATAVSSCDLKGSSLSVQLEAAVSAVAPGQSLVLYGGVSGREVLGGGTIAADSVA